MCLDFIEKIQAFIWPFKKPGLYPGPEVELQNLIIRFIKLYVISFKHNNCKQREQVVINNSN